MQIVRLVMMIVAVAGIIYALEYMERGIAVWFWITLLGVGFVGLLYTFRLTQRRVRLERRARERQEKKKSPRPGRRRRSTERSSRAMRKNPAGRNADLHPPDIVARRFGFRAEACGFPGAAVLFRKSGLVSCRWISPSWQAARPWAAWGSCPGRTSSASVPKSASGSQAAAGVGHDDGGRPAGRGVDVRKYPGNSYLCLGLCHQFRIAAGVGENRVPACRDVPQGFFQERGVRGRLLLRIIERRK